MALYRTPTTNALQYTLDAQLAAGGSSLTLNQSVAGVVRAPGVIVIDRVDSSGNETASKREYITFTGVSGAQLTGLSRGVSNSTDQVHSVGAIVEFNPDVTWANALYDWAVLEHETGGAHVSLPSIQSISFPAKLNPVFVHVGNVSSVSTIGAPLDMPAAGTIQFVSAVLRSPVSSASLILDLEKNNTSIFDAGTRPSILGGGTFVSTASIATKTFVTGDIFKAFNDNTGNGIDVSIKFSAR